MKEFEGGSVGQDSVELVSASNSTHAEVDEDSMTVGGFSVVVA